MPSPLFKSSLIILFPFVWESVPSNAGQASSYTYVAFLNLLTYATPLLLHLTTYTLSFVKNLYCGPQKWGWIWASSWSVVTVTVAPAPVVYQQLHVCGRVLAIQFITLNCLHVTGCAPTTWFGKQGKVWDLPLPKTLVAPLFPGHGISVTCHSSVQMGRW